MSDTAFNLSDQRGPEPGRRERDALALFGNGKSGWLKQTVVSIVLTALVSFAVASWRASGAAKEQISTGLAVIEERQKNQNEAVLRAIQELREDIREIRK